VIIDRTAYEAMIEHMRQVAPREGCGLLAGPRVPPEGEPHAMRDAQGRAVHAWYGVVDRWVPQDNVSEFPRARYEVAPEQTIADWNALDADGRRPWVFCHSHVTTSAAPSENDIRYAVDPSMLHMIVSLAGWEPRAVLWRLDPHVAPPNRVKRMRYEVVDLGFQAIPATDLTRGVSGA
jgi:proteasome lid subunit RPN8/RPN11